MLSTIFARFSALGFSGSRSGVSSSVLSSVVSLVPSGSSVFAGRSAACVRAVSAAGGLWVSFPSSPCPPGLFPSASSSRCFCGLSAGTWSSLAFALGSGVPCLVFSPFGVPAGWGLSPVPGCPGWFGCHLALGAATPPVQLSLF